MSSQVDRLPSHFPVGTRYVIEGRAGRVQSRYIEFPDGRHVDLPLELPAEFSGRQRARPAAHRLQPAPGKILKKN